MITRIEELISEYSVRNKKSEDIPVYSVTNDRGFCTGYFSKEVASKDKSTYKIVPRGYFAYNPSRINVGSVDWQNCEDRVIVSPLYVVFSISEQLDQQYFLHYLKSDIMLNYIKEYATGSVRDNLKLSDLGKLSVNLRPLDEQRRIAAVLDKVSDLIAKRRQQLEKLDLLVKARFVEMFGDPVDNPKQWETKGLAELGECKNGMNFHTEDSGIDIHCLGVGDFKDLSYITDTSMLPMISLDKMPSNEYLLQNGDIVFVRSNGNKDLVGRSIAVFPDQIPTTFSGFCIRFRLKSSIVQTDYLLRTLKTDSVRKKMGGRGANIQNLNQKILSDLQIPIPPLDLQNQFSAFVEQIEKTKISIKESLENMETLKKALMQEYFG